MNIFYTCCYTVRCCLFTDILFNLHILHVSFCLRTFLFHTILQIYYNGRITTTEELFYLYNCTRLLVVQVSLHVFIDSNPGGNQPSLLFLCKIRNEQIPSADVFEISLNSLTEYFQYFDYFTLRYIWLQQSVNLWALVSKLYKCAIPCCLFFFLILISCT